MEEGEKPKPTPLVLALAADPRIQRRVVRRAIIRIGSVPEGEEAAQEAFRVVLEREQDRYCWNPAGPWSAQKYMYRALAGVMSTRRRAAEGDPETPTEDMELHEEGLNPDDASADAEERMAREALADETERLLAADKNGTIPIAMIKASVEHDYEDHTELAAHIGCSLEEVREGQRLITKYASKLVAAFRAKQRRPAK